MSYCPQFWGTAAIYNDRKTQYIFDSYDQKLVVITFYLFLMSYCPQFWGSGEIWMARKTRYMFERYDKKTPCFLHFKAVFMSYFLQFWGSIEIYNNNSKTRYMFESYEQKKFDFLFYDPFHELLPIVLGLQGDFQGP